MQYAVNRWFGELQRIGNFADTVTSIAFAQKVQDFAAFFNHLNI